MAITRFLVGMMALLWLNVAPAEAAPPPLSTYGQLPGFEVASLSPSGAHVAIVGRVEGVRHLLVFDASKNPVKIANLGAMKVRGLEWAGDQSVLVHFSVTADLGLRRAGKQVDLITLPKEDHWLSKSETRFAMLQAAVDFVIRNNPPEPGK